MKQLISALILYFGFGFSAFAQTEQTPCPKLAVGGGGVVRPGESMIFTVNITDLSDISALKYEWEISNGTISSGQGTPSITIDTTGVNTEITAKVKIEGFPENCINTASETGTVFRGWHPTTFDEFGKLSDNFLAARIQNLYIELGNSPDARGFIFNYGTENEIAAREKQIQRAIKRLELDSSRVTVINGGKNWRGTGNWTQIWIIPPDIDTSTFIDILSNKD